MSNKRQWYAIRSDLQKRGLWRYAEAVATKKARTGGTKRAAEPPAEDDPLEGTSAGTAPPPAKVPSLGETVQNIVSTIAGPSAGALRVISVGAQVYGTLTGVSTLIGLGSAGNFAAGFLDAAAGGAGATTEDRAATAKGQASNAPTQEDTTSAPAPQLTETTDPIGNTRPEVPEDEFQPGTTNSLFYDPLNSPQELLQVLITEIGGQDVEMMSEWDPNELEQMLTDLEIQILNAQAFLVRSSVGTPVRVQQKSKHLQLGKFVPV